MNRIALIALLALAGACNFPLLMVEVEAPEVCVTREVSFEANVDPIDYYVEEPPEPQLPSQMGAELTEAFGTDMTIEDNVLELPPELKDMLDVDVQIKAIRVQAKDDPATPEDESTRLDGINLVKIVIVPADPTLPPRTVIAFDRAEQGTPPGGMIEAGGDMFNLATYAYAGQLKFDYGLDVAIPAGGAFKADITTCVSTSGKLEASYNDLKGM